VAHCAECAACARERDEAVVLVAALRSDEDASGLRPVWPVVQTRLRTGLPRLDRSFLFGAGLAATAGLLIGLYLGGTGAGSTSANQAVASASSVFDVSLGSSLPDVYGLTGETGEDGS
jgi:hypothetical protein